MGKNKPAKKSKKPTINKNSTNSKDLKELGNKAFSNKNYEEAIQFYTKAIENAEEDDDEIHIYYSNRSASYFEQQNYKSALEDASECVKIKTDFAKGYMTIKSNCIYKMIKFDYFNYIRKGKAERELLLNDLSLDSASKAIELDPENDAARELFEECKGEWNDDHTVSEENPEKIRFNCLEKWLKEGGSKYDKLKIRFYTPIYRGVHAANKIKAGEEILFVPKHQIITLEMAEESPIGTKMMYHNLKSKLLSPKHGFLTTYILQEKKKGEDSEFFLLIDILSRFF